MSQQGYIPPRAKSARGDDRQPSYEEDVIVNAYAIDSYSQPPPAQMIPQSNMNDGMQLIVLYSLCFDDSIQILPHHAYGQHQQPFETTYLRNRGHQAFKTP